jgi:subtilisin family serine protease
MRRKDCKLLPHIKENLYGLSPDSAQLIGWQIKEFGIESKWSKSQGENVTIGVIDTGCDINHKDIKDNIVQGINIIDPSKDPIDDNGHGSHVAGTIAASNNGLGIVGVAPKAKIAPIKALNGNGLGSNTDIAKAIVWAADNKIDIVTMSLGSEYPSKQIENAIIYAKSKNLIIFCAAGNSGIESGIQYPAKYENTISVGAINRQLDICEFSCCGEELDFVAPGYEIISCIPNNSYAIMSGTSMATPYAVGCAALLLSYRRNLFSNNDLIDINSYISVFSKNCQRVNNQKYSGNKKYEGYGIIRPTF